MPNYLKPTQLLGSEIVILDSVYNDGRSPGSSETSIDDLGAFLAGVQGVTQVANAAVAAALTIATPISTVIVASPDGGVFYYDPGDTTTAANGNGFAGTVIVDASGRRLKRRASEVVTPMMFGAVGDGVADDTAAVTAWGTFVYSVGCASAALIGKLKLTSPVTFTGAATKLIYWGATFTCVFTTEGAALTFVNNFEVVHVGKITVNGNGTATQYSTYTIGQGVSIQNAGVASYGNMLLQKFKYQGLDLSTGISDDCTFGNIETFDIGSWNGSVSTTLANVSARVDNGSSASIGQTTTLTVDAQPPAGLVNGDGFVIIAGNPHVVKAVNAGAGTIDVYPWPDLTFTTGSISYIVGQGVRTAGGDANVLSLDVNAIRVGIGFHCHALYGSHVGRLQCQSVACAIGVGLFNNSNIGLHVDSTYFESSNKFNVLVFTTGDTNMVIEDPFSNPLDLTKWINVSAPRISGTLPSGNYLYPAFTKIKVVVVGNDTVLYPALQVAGSITNSAETIPIGATPSTFGVYKANTLTVNLQSNADLNRLTGLTDVWWWITGTGTNQAPTGTITVQPSTADAGAGYTVNGGASAAFSGFTGPVLFHAYLDTALTGKNWTIAVIEATTAILPKNTGAITPVAVAANTIAEQTFSVTGLATTDAVTVSDPAAQTAGIGIVGCRVSATNTLAIRFINNTAGSLTPVAGTYRLGVIR